MDLFTPQIVTVVGITLVHFLWQGAALGIIIAAVLATCPRAMARTRYLIAGAGLVAMTIAPLVTLGLVWQTAPAMSSGLPMFNAETSIGASAGATSLPTMALMSWLPTAVALWAIGVFTLTTRLLVAWLRTERVRRLDVRPVSDGLQIAVDRLARGLGVGRAVALFESPWVDVPTVIGWLKPTILLPIGALTGLSAQQVEAVLSHELAHIKRHDYLVNVLQNFAETVFFYHPAVWWLSRQIRVEREHCCDDVAVEACGNAVIYARALAALEQSRQHAATLALAATDGSLVDRVRRLVGPAHVDARRPSLPIAACVAVILTIVTLGGAQAQGQGDRELAVEIVPDGLRVAGSVTTSADSPVVAELAPTAEPVPLAPVEPQTLQAQVTPAPPQAPPAPPPPAPIRIGGDIREPRKILHVNPAYPEVARAAGISGVVILEATIDPYGVPVNIKVLRSIPDLDQAAINSVRQWRYVPTLLNGVPVPVIMTVTVNFTLQPSAESWQALERRYATLRQEYEALARTPDQIEAQRSLLRAQMAIVERQIAITRAQIEGPPTSTPGPLAAPTPDGVVPVGGAIKEPQKVRDVPPVYPKIAQASKVSGVVILDIVVGADGRVNDIRVLRSIPMLDTAAIDAVWQWQYTPTLVNGVPTPVQMTVTVNFALN
jgi:TonB family protein